MTIDWTQITESQPCVCGDAWCFGECPECGAHYPYVHAADCRVEESHDLMAECSRLHDVSVNSAQVDHLLAQAVRELLHDPGVHL